MAFPSRRALVSPPLTREQLAAREVIESLRLRRLAEQQRMEAHLEQVRRRVESGVLDPQRLGELWIHGRAWALDGVVCDWLDANVHPPGWSVTRRPRNRAT